MSDEKKPADESAIERVLTTLEAGSVTALPDFLMGAG